MTEQEVRELLLDNMSKAKLQEQAFCVTHRMLAEKIFEKVAGQIIGKDAMMSLYMLADAKSRVSLYTFLENGDRAVDKDLDFYKGFLNIAELIEEALVFVENKWETLSIHRNTRRSHSEIITNLEDIKKWRSSISAQIEQSGRVELLGFEAQSLHCLTDWIMRLILGHELFGKFAEEFNQANAYLNRCVTGIAGGQQSEYKQ